jgi:hypothetical protein
MANEEVYVYWIKHDFVQMTMPGEDCATPREQAESDRGLLLVVHSEKSACNKFVNALRHQWRCISGGSPPSLHYLRVASLPFFRDVRYLCGHYQPRRPHWSLMLQMITHILASAALNA